LREREGEREREECLREIDTLLTSYNALEELSSDKNKPSFEPVSELEFCSSNKCPDLKKACCEKKLKEYTNGLKQIDRWG